MQIQSLSIVVPTEKCVNNCAFCVSKQHSEDYGQNRMAFNNPEIHKAIEDYKKRLAYARDNNCNAVMLTGDAEPTQNRAFLTLFGLLNESLSKPFRHISIQTAGAFLDQNYIEFLRDHVGVNTVSLSISSFVYDINTLYTGAKAIINIQDLCAKIKAAGLNLRISLNMTDHIYGNEQPEPADVFKYVNHYLGADQITFRVLYSDPTNPDCPQNQWIAEHAASPEYIKSIKDYIREYGRPLEVLAFGQTRYDVNGISTVLDDDCMSTQVKPELKYLILRPNCKLYTKWDSTASLLF